MRIKQETTITYPINIGTITLTFPSHLPLSVLSDVLSKMQAQIADEQERIREMNEIIRQGKMK